MIIILLLLLRIRKPKELINDYDKELILFVIDMYLSYGESLDIFPNDNAKEILLGKIDALKNKIENASTVHEDKSKINKL